MSVSSFQVHCFHAYSFLFQLFSLNLWNCSRDCDHKSIWRVLHHATVVCSCVYFYKYIGYHKISLTWFFLSTKLDYQETFVTKKHLYLILFWIKKCFYLPLWLFQEFRVADKIRQQRPYRVAIIVWN